MDFLQSTQNVQANLAAMTRNITVNPATAAGLSEASTNAYGEPGYTRLGTRRGPQYQRALLEFNKLVASVKAGRTPSYFLEAAMSTSDFPYLNGDNLYRQLLGQYQTYEPTYPNYARIIELKDFRNLNLLTLDGGTGALPPVGENGEYPEIKFVDNRYQIQLAKYGERFGLSYEMVVNDDLSAFGRTPGFMAIGARYTEEKAVTAAFIDASGPHASFYTTGNANIVTGNPALSIAGLQTAFTKLAAQTNSDGQPIIIDMVELVVPPALMITANNILNGTELWLATAGGDATTQLHAANWMKNRVRLSVNPFIPLVATTANGNTSWFLFANPNSGIRPALVIGFLQGQRAPQMFMKTSNQTALGGGAGGPFEGSFENDSIDYKVRHFLATARIDPKMTVGSNGSGS